jgi:hypothetical protein
LTLALSQLDPLFVGGTRFCYQDPEHPDRCIKVLRPDRTGEARKARATNWKRVLPPSAFDDQVKELRAYREILARRDPAIWRHVPEFFGTVDTDQGVGIVTRLFRNADGSWPRNLEQQLPEGIDPALKAGIDEFTGFLLDRALVTRDLLPHNLIAVRHEDGSYQVLVVDGIGNADFIPLATWSRFFGRLKVGRKIRKFERRARMLLPLGQQSEFSLCSS